MLPVLDRAAVALLSLRETGARRERSMRQAEDNRGAEAARQEPEEPQEPQEPLCEV